VSPELSRGFYALAFALLVASGIVLGVAVTGFLASTGLLIASAVLSGFAIVAALAALLLPRRR
jgi:hypothetical protein